MLFGHFQAGFSTQNLDVMGRNSTLNGWTKARLPVVNTVQVLNLPSLVILADCPDEEDADSDYDSDAAEPRPVVATDDENVMMAGPARVARIPIQI